MNREVISNEELAKLLAESDELITILHSVKCGLLSKYDSGYMNAGTRTVEGSVLIQTSRFTNNRDAPGWSTESVTESCTKIDFSEPLIIAVCLSSAMKRGRQYVRRDTGWVIDNSTVMVIRDDGSVDTI